MDAAAGARRTVSPGRASRAAAATISRHRRLGTRVHPVIVAADHRDHWDRWGVSRQGGGDHRPVPAQQHDPGQAGGDGGDQRVDVGPLEQPARDPHHPRIGGQGRARRVRVGGLAVVDVVHAADVATRTLRCAPPLEAGQPAATASAPPGPASAARQALTVLCGPGPQVARRTPPRRLVTVHPADGGDQHVAVRARR